MMLKQQFNFFTPPQFNLSTNTVLGTTQKMSIDRTWPIEEIVIVVNVVTSSATLADNVDTILGVVKRVNLAINDGIQPRSVVDYSGPGLLEYASLAGLNLDRSTWEAVRQSVAFRNAALDSTAASFRVAYRIPVVHPMITEPLRTRMLLDCQNHPQDPILTVDFEAATNIVSSAGAITGVNVDVILVRRRMPEQFNAQIKASGGYIAFDLLEIPFTVGTGISGEQRFPISVPGQYANLCIRQYLGGASITRNVLDQTTTIGSESRWRLESGGTVFREWKWKHLQIMNDFSRVANGVSSPRFCAATSAASPTTEFDPSPNFGGLRTEALLFQPASSCMLDFLSDGLNDANELGSLLDTNLPASSGLKMEIIGPVASVATNGSTIHIGGHRYFGDLSAWQALK